MNLLCYLFLKCTQLMNELPLLSVRCLWLAPTTSCEETNIEKMPKIEVFFLIVSIIAVATAADYQVFPASAVVPCGNWTLFMQCDPSWGSQHLGSSSEATICTEGCAMSSTSMALFHRGLDISPGVSANPSTLNKYLLTHNGYADSDLIIWNSTAVLGMDMDLFVGPNAASTADLRKWVSQCQPIVVNVRNGSHWVLIVGYDESSDTTFYVNDPYYNVVSYEYPTMLSFVVYHYNE